LAQFPGKVTVIIEVLTHRAWTRFVKISATRTEA
jgi:hypothetical protein